MAFELVASFFTLTGAGFGEEPRYSFTERCRAAAAAGFTGIGMHADDLPRTVAAGLDVDGMKAVLTDTGLRVVEIEFLGGWALDADPAGLERTVERIEAVADAFGGRHVSTGEFRGDAPQDLDVAATRLNELALRLGRRGLRLAVEAFPWSVLAGPTAVPELLRRAPGAGRRSLAVVRRRQMAVNPGGRHDGQCCFAKPVFGRGGQIVAALGMTVVDLDATLRPLISVLTVAARSLSRELDGSHRVHIPVAR